MKKKCVRVKWIDSASQGGWRGEGTKPVMCYSAGFLVNETKKFIAVSASHDGDNWYNSIIAIPKCAVKSIKRFKM